MRLARSALVVALGAALATGASAGDGVDPQVGSGPPLPGLRDAQNEAAIAVDVGSIWRQEPSMKRPLAVGANDYFDEAPCTGGGCTFAPGVGISGVYFSLDSAVHWTKQGDLKYVGVSRTGDPMRTGRIVTVPRFARRLASHGDPALAFGPTPGATFEWKNGSRLYYAMLAQRFKAPDKGPQMIAVSRTDRLAAAAGSVTSAWLPPVVVSILKGVDVYSDKPALWADNARLSKHFGNVYICWASYRSAKDAEQGNRPSRILFSRSMDGGTSWSTPVRVSPKVGGARRQGCAIRTTSGGDVYVVWEGSADSTNSIFIAQSTDGGGTFPLTRRVVTSVADVGAIDQALKARGLRVRTFDGILGARTNSWPSLDIANGAPFGKDNEHGPAPDTIVVAWASGSLNKEEALVTFSDDAGKTWSPPANAAALRPPAGFKFERPDFPAVAISPNGEMLYVVYTAFHDPWRRTLAGARRMRGVMRVVRFADFKARGSAAAWTELLPRRPVGDARATASVSGEERSLRAGAAVEFIGDYNSVVATNEAGYAVWFDAADAGQCPAVNDFRAKVVRSAKTPLKPPNLREPCKDTFGNGNLFGGVLFPKVGRKSP